MTDQQDNTTSLTNQPSKLGLLPSLLKPIRTICVKLNEIILICSFVVIVTSGLFQVLFRYFLNRPLSWTEELARFSFVWIIFLGAALGVHYASHLGIDFLLKSMNQKVSAVIVIVTQSIVLVMLVFLIRESIMVSLFNMAQVSPALRLPMGVPYMALPIGFAFMFIYLADMTITEVPRLFKSSVTGVDNEKKPGAGV